MGYTVSRLSTVAPHEANHEANGSDPLPWTNIHGVGTLGGRPAAAATNNGYVYLATDTNGGTLYRSNGASWAQTAMGVSANPTPAAHQATHIANASDALPWTTINGKGTLGARPAAAATNAGYTYCATDTNGGTEYQSDGATWTQVSPGVTAAPQAHQASHIANGSDALPWTTIHGSGTLGARPAAAASNSGYVYCATDTAGGTLYLSNGASWTQIAGAVNSTATAATDVQSFTGNGTWNKPSGAIACEVICIGAGGGGGSGRNDSSGNNRSGGAGGAGGGYSRRLFIAADLGSTETVTIGTAGTGGPAAGVAVADGTTGNTGGATTFGSKLLANGGPGGAGGTATTSAGGVASTLHALHAGGNGGAGGSGAGAAGIGASIAAGGGAAGGGGSSGTELAGGVGGVADQIGDSPAGGTSGAARAAGGDGAASTHAAGGSGGGGGGATILSAGNGGAGGNGGLYGGGGGGGGAGGDGTSSTGKSGAGGNGAAGYCRVITYF